MILAFQKLTKDDIRRELRARGVPVDDEMKKDELHLILDNTLRGVARVPALLITNPAQSLQSLGLQRYEVVANEPLHDLKGHITNLITELPHILKDESATECSQLMESCLSKEKKSGADLRRVIIQIYLLLKDITTCSAEVLLLLETIIVIGEISYSPDMCRTMSWLHMELCIKLLSKPHEMSTSRMFGLYLHALATHSPTQYELSLLRSLQVSHVAKHLPKFGRTRVDTSFIQDRKDSWQAHLVRISPFLVAGEVWWNETEGGYEFFDGEDDSNTHSNDGFTLHFREHTVGDVEHRRDACWSKILREKILLPAGL